MCNDLNTNKSIYIGTDLGLPIYSPIISYVATYQISTYLDISGLN